MGTHKRKQLPLMEERNILHYLQCIISTLQEYFDLSRDFKEYMKELTKGRHLTNNELEKHKNIQIFYDEHYNNEYLLFLKWLNFLENKELKEFIIEDINKILVNEKEFQRIRNLLLYLYNQENDDYVKTFKPSEINTIKEELEKDFDFGYWGFWNFIKKKGVKV